MSSRPKLAHVTTLDDATFTRLLTDLLELCLVTVTASEQKSRRVADEKARTTQKRRWHGSR